MTPVKFYTMTTTAKSLDKGFLNLAENFSPKFKNPLYGRIIP